MSFEILVKKSALKFIESLDSKQKSRLSEAIDILKEEPVPVDSYDIIKLGGYENSYRIRLGRIRIVYEVLWNERRIIVHFAGWRENAY